MSSLACNPSPIKVVSCRPRPLGPKRDSRDPTFLSQARDSLLTHVGSCTKRLRVATGPLTHVDDVGRGWGGVRPFLRLILCCRGKGFPCDLGLEVRINNKFQLIWTFVGFTRAVRVPPANGWSHRPGVAVSSASEAASETFS